MEQVRAIDADGHITEPVDLWGKYLERRYQDLAPRFVRTPDGVDAISFLGIDHVPGNEIGLPGAGLAGKSVGPRTKYEHRYVDGHQGGFDPHARLAVMDKEGIDIAVLFPTLSAVPIAAIPDEGFATALARAYNNWLADFCHVAPQRLFGAAQVPLLHLDAALREVDRAVVELDMKMIVLRPNPYAGRLWTDRAYDPLWGRLQRLNVPVAFHEGTYPKAIPTAGADRFDNFLFQHVISHPFEQQLVCLSLVAGGVLERFPRLRVAFMESGCGWLPYWLQRIDEHCEELPWMAPDLTMRPSEYFRRQCFISVEAKDSEIAHVANAIGSDRLLFASDFPHYDAVFPGAVRAFVSNCGLTRSHAMKVLADNAAQLLGLPVTG
ncbi:MAG TPA: amidohydrolase family protein [Candidatus Binatia bacterium]|nr:amidohydrolase family protein [Candidatus Binatia bacterium]